LRLTAHAHEEAKERGFLASSEVANEIETSRENDPGPDHELCAD